MTTTTKLVKYGDSSAQPGEFAIRMQSGILRLKVSMKPGAVIPTALIVPTWEPTLREEVSVPYVDGSLVKGIVAKLEHIFANVIPDLMPINLGDRNVIRNALTRLSDTQIEPSPARIPPPERLDDVDVPAMRDEAG